MNDYEDITDKLSALHVRLPGPSALRAVRLAAGMTQSEVAEAVGVDRATVSRWENGKREPHGDNRARYATAISHMRKMLE